MFKILPVISSYFYIRCSKGLMNGDLQANLEKADKVYGAVTILIIIFKIERDICLDKQRAAVL